MRATQLKIPANCACARTEDCRNRICRVGSIPQASSTHAGITLTQFKWIYWWEWFHRNVARTVGLVFAIPWLLFMVQGRIPRALRLRLTALPLLTLGQGALGWYMVQSGLVERISVSAYRLTAHLGLALGILAVSVWTYSELRARTAAERSDPVATPRRWQRALLSAALLLGITVLSGGFVAGLRGGRIFNEFPLMGGQVVPPGYGTLTPWWSNAFENPAAAQIHHRLLALTVTAFVLTLAWRSRSAPLPQAVRRAVFAFGAVITTQLVLGITTLLLAVPVPLGVLHQFTGVLALTAALVATQRAMASCETVVAPRDVVAARPARPAPPVSYGPRPYGVANPSLRTRSLRRLELSALSFQSATSYEPRAMSCELSIGDEPKPAKPEPELSADNADRRG